MLFGLVLLRAVRIYFLFYHWFMGLLISIVVWSLTQKIVGPDFDRHCSIKIRQINRTNAAGADGNSTVDKRGVSGVTYMILNVCFNVQFFFKEGNEVMK